MVYVMPYGSSYRVSKSCRSIIAYVQAVLLPQVEYLGEVLIAEESDVGDRGCYLLGILNGDLTEQS